jgi:hypothetical protein
MLYTLIWKASFLGSSSSIKERERERLVEDPAK